MLLWHILCVAWSPLTTIAKNTNLFGPSVHSSPIQINYPARWERAFLFKSECRKKKKNDNTMAGWRDESALLIAKAVSETSEDMTNLLRLDYRILKRDCLSKSARQSMLCNFNVKEHELVYRLCLPLNPSERRERSGRVCEGMYCTGIEEMHCRGTAQSAGVGNEQLTELVKGTKKSETKCMSRNWNGGIVKRIWKKMHEKEGGLVSPEITSVESVAEVVSSTEMITRLSMSMKCVEGNRYGRIIACGISKRTEGKQGVKVEVVESMSVGLDMAMKCIKGNRYGRLNIVDSTIAGWREGSKGKEVDTVVKIGVQGWTWQRNA